MRGNHHCEGAGLPYRLGALIEKIRKGGKLFGKLERFYFKSFT